MSFEYGKVVKAIKETKKEILKLPRFVKVIIPICSVFVFIYMIGLNLMGSNLKWGTSQAFWWLVLAVIGIVGVITCLIIFYRCNKSYEPIEKAKIQKYLNSLAEALRNCGIKTQQDISDLQAEIERSRAKSEKNLTQVISGVKYIFGIVCVSPIGFLLAAFWGSIFSGQGNNENVQEVWDALMALLGYLFLCGILIIGLFILLSMLAYTIRESIGKYAEQEQVYKCLEDMKYLFRFRSERSGSERGILQCHKVKVKRLKCLKRNSLAFANKSKHCIKVNSTIYFK